MIQITTNSKNLSILASGHSSYAQKGSDIVCAAVSILMYSYAAELMRQCSRVDIRDDGYRFEISTDRRNVRTTTAYDTVISGLRMLADTYRNNITITEESKWQKH